MKKNIKPSSIILCAFLLALLTGCLPMSEAQITTRAQKRYANLSKPTAEPAPGGAARQEISKADLAERQVLNLSGRDIYYTDPALAYNEDWLFINQVFVGLTRQEIETGEFLPLMAKDWDVSADGLTWTFHLREGIPWVTYDDAAGQVVEAKDDSGNTRYVTSADFKTAILRVLDPTTYSGNAFVLYGIQGAWDFKTGAGSADAVGVQTPAEDELVIQLTEPLASLDAMAELPVLSAFPSWLTYVADHLEYSYGPYAVKEYFSSYSLTLVRNPLWLAGKDLPEAFLEEIHFNLKEGQDALAAYEAGEIDALKLYPEEIATVKSDPELAGDLRYTNGTCGYYLVFFNADTLPLNTPEARQAIAAAIDKDKLVSSLAPDTGLALDQYVPPFLRGSKDYQDQTGIDFDADSAREKAAGIELNGLPLTLVSPDSSNYSSTAEMIAQELETNLGIEVTTDIYPWTDFMTSVKYNYYNSGIYLLGYCLDYADAQNLWDRWLDADFYADVANLRWFNQEFSDALLQAKEMSNLDARVDLYQQAEEVIVDQDTVIVPLFWRKDAWLIDPKLAAPEWLLYPQLEEWAFLK